MYLGKVPTHVVNEWIKGYAYLIFFIKTAKFLSKISTRVCPQKQCMSVPIAHILAKP